MDVERLILRTLEKAVRDEVEAKVEARLAPLRERCERLRAKAAHVGDRSAGHALLARLDEAELCLRLVDGRT